MSTSSSRVCEPARYDEWGLGADRVEPRELVVYRYASSGTRHRAPYRATRLAFPGGWPAAMVALTDRCGVPEGIARCLVFALSAKLASPRWQPAD